MFIAASVTRRDQDHFKYRLIIRSFQINAAILVYSYHIGITSYKVNAYSITTLTECVNYMHRFLCQETTPTL